MAYEGGSNMTNTIKTSSIFISTNINIQHLFEGKKKLQHIYVARKEFGHTSFRTRSHNVHETLT